MRSTVCIGIGLAIWGNVVLGDSPRSAIYTPEEDVASCLVGRCSVYSATINSIGPLANAGPPSAPAVLRGTVTLHIDEVLLGPRDVASEVVRTHEIPVDDPLQQIPGSSRTWAGIAARKGEKIIIVEQRESSDVLVAISQRSHFAGEIRSLIAISERVTRDPSPLSAVVSMLRPKEQPFTAAYIIEALPARMKPDDAVALLSVLLGKEGFSARQRQQIEMSLGLHVFAASEPARRAAIAQLVYIAAFTDLERALSAMSELRWIWSNKPFEFPKLNATQAATLRRNFSVSRVRAPNVEPGFEEALIRATKQLRSSSISRISTRQEPRNALERIGSRVVVTRV